jgi:hypothetical protein
VAVVGVSWGLTPRLSGVNARPDPVRIRTAFRVHLARLLVDVNTGQRRLGEVYT